MGKYRGPAKTGDVIELVSPKLLTGKYVVIQLTTIQFVWKSLALNEVKVVCAGEGEVFFKNSDVTS